MKALIVDDDVFVRQCLIQMLPWQLLDFSQVLEASNGTEALELARQDKPELVITDVKMPRMSGLELARLLKQEMLDVCVILLSEYNDFAFVHGALQCGVDDYILKPLMPAKLEEIAEKIRKLMSEMEMRRYYTSLRSDPAHIRAVIREAVESGNGQTLADSAEYLARNMIHRDDLRHFGVMILTELFGQAETVSPPQERSGAAAAGGHEPLCRHPRRGGADPVHRRCLRALRQAVRQQRVHVLPRQPDDRVH